MRQKDSRPRVEEFRVWCDAQLARIPGKGELAKAIRYALNRWNAFTPRTAGYGLSDLPSGKGGTASCDWG
ncbi:MAG: transposase [Gluconacetobacter liquefaciens]